MITITSPFGALVVSLDLELHWGVRDKQAVHGPYRENFQGVREAVARMLDTFRQYEIAATWATVGFLFARTRDELEQFSPRVRPRYRNARLDPYREAVGSGEADDPFHYAPSLIELIRGYPRQEIATHTYSHFFCLEPGQDEEAFSADLESAVSIARARSVDVKSIVFPRNQHNREYEDVLLRNRIDCYRGNPRAWMYRAGSDAQQSRIKRAFRLLDAYVNLAGPQSTDWSRVRTGRGLCNVPASFLVRPYRPRLERVEFLRLRRITRAMTHAARTRRIVHLWWHPHNFGVHRRENLAFLRRILQHYRGLRDRYAMESLNMSEIARYVLADNHEQG